ncbi:MAG: hypothetical protein HPY71_10880 [Firmicutes bacterium]|nr:hypothetical protein [Bacillota bacterium]
MRRKVEIPSSFSFMVEDQGYYGAHSITYIAAIAIKKKESKERRRIFCLETSNGQI